MSPSYADLKDETEEVKSKLEMCISRLVEIKPEGKAEYPNPKLRLWSGDIKDLEGFATGLEEWLSQPPIAEAKRYLSDLKNWSESADKISLEEVETDWRFLSDNVEEIKEIHGQIESIGYETIKKKVSAWVLKRIIEKDVERAAKWAANANKFAVSVKQLEAKEVESKLAQETKNDAIKELLKTDSFDKDNKEAIDRCQQLVNRSEAIVKNKPIEISEKAVLKTYKMGKDLEKSISIVSTEVENIRKLLVELEWVRKISDFKGYSHLWDKKHTALKENDLESINSALRATQQIANEWKEARRKEMDGAFISIERMLKSVEKDNLKGEATFLEEKKRSINWSKPDLVSLSEILCQMERLRSQLREELIGKLQNDDAIVIIEEPEIIEDLGRKKGWDFDRFIAALGVVLRNGLIEIRATEEK